MKRTNTFFLICATMLLSLSSHARSTNTKQADTNHKIVLTGTVTDKMGKKLKGAPVEVLNSNDYTLTNQDGYYSIEATPGSKIRISYIGHNADTLTIHKSEHIDVKLYTDEDFKAITKNKNRKGNWFIGGGAGISTGF